MLAGDIKDFLSIKIKYRSDSFSDQFSRILIMKMLLVFSSIMGISWFKDSIHCVVPSHIEIDPGFVSAACWIQGVFVYRELKGRFDDIAYYGIPQDIEMDGLLENGVPCNTQYAFSKKMNLCKPMTKTFFLQYQWFPFYIAALSLCFYLPYVLHLMANEDLISLKKNVKSQDSTADSILSTYFNYTTNPKTRLRLRIVYNYVIKILYVVVNVISFVVTDRILLGKFKNYGSKWIEWTKLPNTIAHDYMGARDFPKPGNELLPPFGYCELYESAKDVKTSMANKYRFVCEMSQNILYQYCLIIIWFLFVIGICVSLIGLLMLFVDHVITITCIMFRGTAARKIYTKLSLRECEYLEFIRKRNIPLYSEIILKLRLDKFNGSLPCDTPPPAFDDLSSKNSTV